METVVSMSFQRGIHAVCLYGKRYFVTLSNIYDGHFFAKIINGSEKCRDYTNSKQAMLKLCPRAFLGKKLVFLSANDMQ